MSKPSSRPSKIKSQDAPFDLDVLEREASKSDYRFILGGREWRMTPMGRLDRKVMRRLAKLAKDGNDNSEYMDELLKAAMGEEQFAEFNEIPLSMEALNALVEDWTAHSGIELGESSASASS
jgi:hypothetical protein